MGARCTFVGHDGMWPVRCQHDTVDGDYCRRHATTMRKREERANASHVHKAWASTIAIRARRYAGPQLRQLRRGVLMSGNFWSLTVGKRYSFRDGIGQQQTGTLLRIDQTLGSDHYTFRLVDGRVLRYGITGVIDARPS